MTQRRLSHREIGAKVRVSQELWNLIQVWTLLAAYAAVATFILTRS